MILETLLYAASAPLAQPEFRPFVAASVSLWSRARRCRAAWGPHEARAKAAVGVAVARLRQRRTVVVLGSGLCRDVPLEALARAFDTVVLVDLVHLLPVRLMALRLRNIRLIERDLASPEGLGFLRQVPFLDLVISATMLSQLPVGLKRRPGPPPGEAEIAAVLNGHLQGLAALPCPALLLTDTDYRAVDRSGREAPTEDLLPGITAPQAFEDWRWTVIPYGEEDPAYRIDHTVVAAHLGAHPR